MNTQIAKRQLMKGLMTFLFVLVYQFSLQAKDSFNVKDSPSPDGFKPEYTFYIFGGMFVIGIAAYFLLTKLNKDPRKREGVYDPRVSNQHLRSSSKNKYGSAGSKTSRRRNGQKKTIKTTG